MARQNWKTKEQLKWHNGLKGRVLRNSNVQKRDEYPRFGDGFAAGRDCTGTVTVVPRHPPRHSKFA